VDVGNETTLLIKRPDPVDPDEGVGAVPWASARAVDPHPGWWLLRGDVHPRHEERLLASLREAEAALLLQGGPEDVGRVVVFERGADPIDLMWGYLLDDMPVPIPRAETSPDLIAWTQRHAPQPFTEETAQAFWMQGLGASGAETVEGLIARLGWGDRR
jgi:hypothetical protein